jgi:hypothetical protein
MRDLLVTFGLVFLAELGDQSMLLAIGFAARYWPWPVLGGIAIAAFTMLWLSTRAGRRSASRCRTGARDRRRPAVRRAAAGRRHPRVAPARCAGPLCPAPPTGDDGPLP